MGTLLLGYLGRVFDWVVQKLEDIVEYPEDYVLAEELRGIWRLYNSGADADEIIQQYPSIRPEIIHLLIAKLDAQNGCLDTMNRFFLTIMS